jgi:hypothetical protein
MPRILGIDPVTIANPTFTGVAEFPGGTVSAPGIVWDADNDGTGTGLYRPAANQIGFANNGVQTGLIDAAGTFTIGATGNTTAHTVNGQAIFTSPQPGANAVYAMRNTGATPSSVRLELSSIGVTASSTQALSFRAGAGGATENWSILSDGTGQLSFVVGVATNILAFNTSGQMFVQNGAAGTTKMFVGNSGAPDIGRLGTDGSGNFTIGRSGNHIIISSSGIVQIGANDGSAISHTLFGQAVVAGSMSGGTFSINTNQAFANSDTTNFAALALRKIRTGNVAYGGIALTNTATGANPFSRMFMYVRNANDSSDVVGIYITAASTTTAKVQIGAAGDTVTEHAWQGGAVTSATAGAASALPGVPAGYLQVQINGTSQRIPYWNA